MDREKRLEYSAKKIEPSRLKQAESEQARLESALELETSLGPNNLEPHWSTPTQTIEPTEVPGNSGGYYCHPEVPAEKHANLDDKEVPSQPNKHCSSPLTQIL